MFYNSNIYDEKIYNGEWKNNLRNGSGILTFLNNDIFVGNWLDNEENGIGKYIENNGLITENIWVNGIIIK